MIKNFKFYNNNGLKKVGSFLVSTAMIFMLGNSKYTNVFNQKNEFRLATKPKTQSSMTSDNSENVKGEMQPVFSSSRRKPKTNVRQRKKFSEFDEI